MPVSKLELNKRGEIPIVGLGTGKVIIKLFHFASFATYTFNFHLKIMDIQEIDETIENAIKLGYRLFDTAYGYKNETGIGQAIKKQLDKGQVSREELYVITKVSKSQRK
jgi:diketogulonate reductase-like aldo/keto reductase